MDTKLHKKISDINLRHTRNNSKLDKRLFENNSSLAKKSIPNSTGNRFLSSLLRNIKNTTFNRISIKDQTFFIKRLSFLIKAGVPILESLILLREQTHKRSYALMLDSVILNVSNGQNLSSSLAVFKNTFGEFAINIICYGEESGLLSQNLEYIADELRKKQALRRKIINASIYPIIVTIATIGIVIFLMIFLFPKILPIFSSLKYDLPFPTKIVMLISSFVSHWGILIFIIFIVLTITLLTIINKYNTVRFYFHKFLLNMPVIGKIMRDFNMANFTRTMGLLMNSGTTIGEALPICVKTTPNLVYRKEYEMLSIVVNKGSQISTYLGKNRNLFPDIVTQLISVGEHSGNLSSSLIYLSEMYEAEIDDFTKNLSIMIEPVLMIVMGMLVGFIAVSIVMPIYGITQHLHG